MTSLTSLTGEPGVAQRLRRAAGGDELPAELASRPRANSIEASLVGNGKQVRGAYQTGLVRVVVGPRPLDDAWIHHVLHAQDARAQRFGVSAQRAPATAR